MPVVLSSRSVEGISRGDVGEWSLPGTIIRGRRRERACRLTPNHRKLSSQSLGSPLGTKLPFNGVNAISKLLDVSFTGSALLWYPAEHTAHARTSAVRACLVYAALSSGITLDFLPAAFITGSGDL